MQVIRPYIFDSEGYHEIENEINIRAEDFGSECDLTAGQYCIDPKLLAILVGWEHCDAAEIFRKLFWKLLLITFISQFVLKPWTIY